MIENMVEQEQVLKVTDRCDRCGAQAFVLVEGTVSELLFCAHHYNKIMKDPVGVENLNKFAYRVIDEREFIR